MKERLYGIVVDNHRKTIQGCEPESEAIAGNRINHQYRIVDSYVISGLKESDYRRLFGSMKNGTEFKDYQFSEWVLIDNDTKSVYRNSKEHLEYLERKGSLRGLYQAVSSEEAKEENPQNNKSVWKTIKTKWRKNG